MHLCRRHRRVTLCYDPYFGVGAVVITFTFRRGLRFIAVEMVVDTSQNRTDCLSHVDPAQTWYVELDQLPKLDLYLQQN